MNGSPVRPPSWPFGAASFVLGLVGLLLFFLPILGAPLCAIGAVAGVVGCFVAGLGGAADFRWSVAGVALCTFALAVNLAIAYAPAGYQSIGTGPPKQSVPDAPYVAPPAR